MGGSPIKPKELRQGHAKRKGGRPELTALPARSPLGVPDPPTGLLRSSKQLWDSYWRSPVATVALAVDLSGLERWIISVDEWTRAMRTMRKERMVEGSAGQPRLNPLCSYIADRERAIKGAEERYGLNPQARLRLGISAAQARITAAQLNETLEAHDDSDPDPILAEYEEA